MLTPVSIARSGFIASGQVGWPHHASGAVRSGHLSTTGVPDGSKFLRDDFSWAAAGGGLSSGAVGSGYVASGSVQGFFGTTRHIVQGAIDIVGETWDRATRTLRATSQNLDARAYAVTIAVPPGLEPGECTAEIPCTVKHLPSGHVVVEWPDGTQGKDVEWQLRFT